MNPTKKEIIKPQGWNYSKDYFQTIAQLNEELCRFRQVMNVEESLKCFETLFDKTAPFIWVNKNDEIYLLWKKRITAAFGMVFVRGMNVVERQEKASVVMQDVKAWDAEYTFLLKKYGLLVPIKEVKDERHMP